MNRVAEFRGKTDDGDFVFGSYVHNKRTVAIIDDDDVEFEVDPKTIGQFTGVIDCEKSKIYEYDFVVFVGGGETPKIVRRSRNHPEFRLYSCALDGFNVGLSYTLDIWQSLDDFKVVGNIFDNPDLIPREVYDRIMEMINYESDRRNY